MIEVGAKVDAFEIQDHQGNPVSWASFRGKPVVFFFYPKASTPGCTKEACAFTELGNAFSDAGIQVVGISADSVKRQSNFATKYGLTMPLLADTEMEVIKGWGAWGEKKMYGKTYEGIIRSTFLFDADGTLVHVWPKVRVKGHAEEVLETATRMLS